MILIKLGGSVVTDKSRPFSIREDVISRLAQEIRRADKEIILVHGGGSFGHPVAREHNLQEGLTSKEQIVGVAKTRAAMGELNQRIVKSLVESKVNAVSIQTSSIFRCRNRRISEAHVEALSDFLRLGAVPVLYGDVAVDSSLGVCILSGDQIVSYLARELSAEKVVFATDVDGLLDADGMLVKEVTEENFKAATGFAGARSGDVTGGMRGKIEELSHLMEAGIPSIVVNALVEGRVENALLGKNTHGTVFKGIAHDRG